MIYRNRRGLGILYVIYTSFLRKSELILRLHSKNEMKILIVESFLVLALFAVHSHQLNQGQALDNLLNRRRRSQYGVSRDYRPSYTTQNLVDQSQVGSQDADLIHGGLPGQPSEVEFSQYSGYVTVDSSAGRALFYYFAEATQNRSTNPLILWLNGGPGCSSFGYGAMYEVGPFGVNSDSKTLHRNPYAWNQVANILFLESPAGVGFSYSNTTSDYDESGDKRTAADSYTFLVNWFERFPEYKHRDFYIIGESYAGYYIPELADTILYHKNRSEAPFINLKGIMVGNGLINDATDRSGRYDYLWSHALISDQTYQEVRRSCQFSGDATDSVACNNIMNEMDGEMGNIDQYNIYAPICHRSSSKHAKSSYAGQLERGEIPGYDPCFDQYIEAYLNRVDVQRTLHVSDSPYQWKGCSDTINAQWKDMASTMFPFYREFIRAGLRIVIYSGDVDSIVPVTSTRYSINGLKLPIQTSWYAWLNGNEIGGYCVIYDGLTLVTVRGAGHQVPSFQPDRALTLLRYFLAGKPLPQSPS